MEEGGQSGTEQDPLNRRYYSSRTLLPSKEALGRNQGGKTKKSLRSAT